MPKISIPSVPYVSPYVNNLFVGKDAWQVSVITSVSILTSLWLFEILSDHEGLYDRLKKKVFTLVKKIPAVSKKIDEECKKVYNTFEEEVIKRNDGLPYITTLPNEPLSTEKILELVNVYLEKGKTKYDYTKGCVSGAVYCHDEKLINLVGEVNQLTLYSNPLHPDIFPGICKMEAEIIKIVANLFHGGHNCCGSVTSGGTESILMACKSYRDYGLKIRGIKNPEMIIPVTAHAAFDKAGAYFGIRIKHIDLDEDVCVNLKRMKRAISGNTIMLVGSTPNFPFGTMDNIQEIAKLGLKYNIPVHVDCCLGSLVLPFMTELGFDLPPFDFSLPGVTSMSVDTHKYGFAPKGTSVILYSDIKYRHHQYFSTLSWPGGHYGSPTISGSRSGAVVASCWTTLLYYGKSGYLDSIGKILHISRYIEEKLRKIPGIFVFGKPLSTVIAIGSNDFHIYRLSEELTNKNWNLNMLQFPFGIHICLTQLHTLPGVADRFINDVTVAVDEIIKNPRKELVGKTAMYGMSATLPDRSLVGDFTNLYMDSLYYTPK